MSSQGAYVPGTVRWLIVVSVAVLVVVAAFWRPETIVERPGPLGIADRGTWVEASAYGVLTLATLYALGPTLAREELSALSVPVFVTAMACLVEAGQFVAASPFDPVDPAAAALVSLAVALVWDAGLRAVRSPA